jgi:regulator of sigma E protease
LGTELILFADLLDALLWLVDPGNWWIIFQVALGLGFVIFVHELGHFLVAKACGVKCEKFYIGFDIYGLALKKRWGETEYGIGILPLGGYVKMLGQDDNPYRAAEEMKRARGGGEPGLATAAAAALPSGDLPPEPTSDPHPPYDPRSYMAQSVPERMAIISAGVIMNVIFAFIMATIAYLIGVKELPCRVGEVSPGGAAWQAGIEVEDEVVRIGKLENPTFDDLRTNVSLGDLENGLPFVIRRPGEDDLLEVVLHPDRRYGLPMIGVGNPVKLHVGIMRPHTPGAKASPEFQRGDRIVEINGQPVRSVREFRTILAESLDQTLSFGIERIDEPADVVKSKRAEDPNYEPKTKRLLIEVASQPYRDLGMQLKMGPIVALQTGAPADKAGIQVGDTLLKIDGADPGDPMTLDDRLAARGASTVELTLLRGNGDGKTFNVSVPLREVDWYEEPMFDSSPVSLRSMGIALRVEPVVAAVEPDGPAAKAGILPGDELLSFQFPVPASPNKAEERVGDEEVVSLIGDKATTWPAFMRAVQSRNPTGKVRLMVKTGDEEPRQAEMLPVELDGFFVPERGVILEPDYQIRTAVDFGEAARLGYRKTVDSLLMVYRFLQKLYQGQISPKLLGGPVTIAKAAGSYAEQGLAQLLIFLTMLSANLAVVNFLPIPVLDGGHMVFLIYEGITGKPPSERVFVLLTYIGFAFILTLMMFVLGLDFGFISRR